MKTDIKKIRDDVVRIIVNSPPTFFVNERNKKLKVSEADLIYETTAEICNNVEMYFYKLLEK